MDEHPLSPPLGLLLLTGGEGRRFGGPKHLQAHPRGGTWAGYLVRVFRRAIPDGPIQILGAPVPELPELGSLQDPRSGPARALAFWASGETPQVRRWWVLACDQVHWTVPGLEGWLAKAKALDPEGQAWVMAEAQGRIQYLGGFLGSALMPRLAGSGARSLREMAASMPCRIMPDLGPQWRDVDCPGDFPSGI